MRRKQAVNLKTKKNYNNNKDDDKKTKNKGYLKPINVEKSRRSQMETTNKRLEPRKASKQAATNHPGQNKINVQLFSYCVCVFHSISPIVSAVNHGAKTIYMVDISHLIKGKLLYIFFTTFFYTHFLSVDVFCEFVFFFPEN